MFASHYNKEEFFMGFKIGMLVIASAEKKYVFDKDKTTGIPFAEVRFDVLLGQFALRYLDGSMAILNRSITEQMGPGIALQHTVPTKDEFLCMQQFEQGTYYLNKNDVLFGDELVPQNQRAVFVKRENNQHDLVSC
jgi:hypothetical protein